MRKQNEAGRRGTRRKDKEVERLVDEFEASGLELDRILPAPGSGAEHAAETSACEAAAKWESGSLVAVSVSSRTEAKPKAQETGLEVLLPVGVQIGLRPSFDPGTLRELITGSFGPQTAKQRKTFWHRRSQRSQRFTIFKSQPMHLGRDTYEEVDPGVGGFCRRDCLCDLCGLLCK
jgi:hypothetical protein